ncbi:hypothetical protein MBRA1_003902 [Malassezia brasiliensis]|uniref:C3H1-type domain-containing protein n=1 Tax=Malassezia brasiliensis TaxID=1821822 RepID=A0AAF0DWS1_9BASI|nr:hypothetical protein MBRA1_003902 [Malassezia brasiliensis]
MLFPQEDAEAVKQWLLTELEPLSDADPDVLADYVLALFKYDTGEQELLAMMNEQLVDFLEDQTEAFVTKAYHALKSGAYRTDGARKRPADDPAEVEAGAAPKRQAYADDAMADELPDNPEGMPMSDAPVHARPRRNARAAVPKGWCRDYHALGYCARGNQCKFVHSDDRITAPVPPLPGLPPPDVPWAPEQMAMAMEHMQQMVASGQLPEGLPLPPLPPMPPMLAVRGARGGMRGRGARGRGGRGGLGGRPAPVRSQDTLVIEHIPTEHLNLASVNDYFKRFGTITNIDVDEPGARAVVSYATHDEAERAHSSPDVIFGNRFVKVYFQRLDAPARPVKPLPSKTHYMKDEGSNKYLAPALRAQADAPRAQPGDAERRKLLELRKKKQTLLHMQIAEQKALLAKLEHEPLTPQGRQSVMAMLEKLSGEIQAATELLKKEVPPPSAPATTEELQAHLAALRQEAAALGLDASGHARGRGRGRGRALPFRGRGGAPGARSMSLDHRTTRVGVAHLPADVGAEQLHAHLAQYGALQSLDREGDRYVAHFQTRAAAEKAMRSGAQAPPLRGAELSWVEAPAKDAAAGEASEAPAAAAALESGEADPENWKRA